jgi:signal transduction histidine kinase
LALIKEFRNDPDPRFFYELGLHMSRLRTVGALEQLVRLFPSPRSVVTRIPELNRRFNRIFDMQVSAVSKDSAELLVRYREDLRNTYLYEMCPWNQGIVASIPSLWDLPTMSIRETHCLFTIPEIVDESYAYLRIDSEFVEGRFLANGDEIARQVRGQMGTGAASYLTTSDLVVENVPVLQKGIVYGAPCCRYELSWENRDFLMNLRDLTLGRMARYLDSRRALREQLEYTEAQFFEIRRLHDELQVYAEGLEDLVEERTAQLFEEEKARRVYQIRAAQAQAVAHFLHQTSNLVLQPLASTMIVFEDLIEIAGDCRTEWGEAHQDDNLLQELNDGLARVEETYPTASLVIDGYRKLFHAFYEVYVSAQTERDVNQDLRYIQTLVDNKYILTQVPLSLELDKDVPLLKLEGGMQSIFLELMHNAARCGADRLLVKTAYQPEADLVRVCFYNDGPPIPEDEWNRLLRRDVNHEGGGFGLADARYIVETLNGGQLRLVPSDREEFFVLFVIDVPINPRPEHPMRPGGAKKWPKSGVERRA